MGVNDCVCVCVCVCVGFSSRERHVIDHDFR
jgi:hypothetical protein